MATTAETAKMLHRGAMSLRAAAERSRDPRVLHGMRIACAQLGEACDD